MRKAEPRPKPAKVSTVQAQDGCVCGAVPTCHRAGLARPLGRQPPRAGLRLCHLCRLQAQLFRVLEGDNAIGRYENAAGRSFCTRCGPPLFYKRARSPIMVNISRALFESRTGRKPCYQVPIHEMADWTSAGEPLAPLKRYPGVVWERPKRTKRRGPEPMF